MAVSSPASGWHSAARLLAGVVALLALLLGGIAPAQANTTPANIHQLINRIALEEGVDPELLRALVAVESDFDQSVVSRAGAVGLTQLMPETARLLGVKNRHDPEQNLRGGARYLRQMLEQFDTVQLALAAYNAGPGAVSRHQGIPPYPETRRYVDKVLRRYRAKKGFIDYLRQSKRDYLQVVNGREVTPTPHVAAGQSGFYRYRGRNGRLVLSDTHPAYRHQSASVTGGRVLQRGHTATPGGNDAGLPVIRLSR